MVSKIAATALVLIVAAPIMLGYALALTEEEITGWETTESVNITDVMTNSSNNIYTTSVAPANNSQIYTRITYPGSGVTEYSLLAPNYVSTGSVYSSIPTYTSSTYNYTLESSVTTTTSGTNGGSYSYIEFSSISTRPVLYISTNQLSQINVDGDSSLGTSFGPFVDAGGKWIGQISSSESTIVQTTHIEVVSDRYPTYTVTYRPYTKLDPDVLGTEYSFSLPANSAIKYSILDSVYDHIITPDNTSTMPVIRSGNTLIVDGVAYDDVDDVYVSTPASADTLYCKKLVATGQYADPSYGWNVNLSPGNAVYPYWMNGSVNDSVRMMIAISNGEFLDLQCIDSDDNSSSVVSIRKTSGTVTVGGETLGKYSYLCADISGSSVTVSGISAWPNMYTAPQLINSITVDMVNTVENFVRVYLSASTTMEFRVDSAEILSGTFGTIEDYTLTMTNLWPSDSYSVALTSAGVYGSSITFAGQTYAVADGRITVNGSSIPVRSAVFSAIYDDDSSTWSNQLNGVELSTSATPSTIIFGGEWSMTVAAYKMQEVTSTDLVWQPGEFAFNGVDSDFALMGLLGCIVTFIALGIYGARSGAKVGTLMIICGCAAFVFLALM